MNSKKNTAYVIAGIIILLVIYAFISFNGLVRKDEKVKQQWNEVQSAYQRRIDLIPNLVNVVKGQAEFEQGTLVQISEARAAAASTVSGDLTPEKFNQQTAAQNQLAAATNRLVITIEKYPQLKGAEAFAGLQVQLEGTERRIKFARKDFNTAIADYNSTVKSFPTKIFAALFGFPPKDGFQADTGADQSIEIKF